MNRKFDTIWLDRVDSTNDEALRRIADIDNMSVIAAENQTAGKGQRGNTWESESGRNLTFSAVIKFTGEHRLNISEQFILTVAATCAVADYLESHGVGCSIKWPNDIWHGKRKICGMLIENKVLGTELAASVIGIGINLNQKEFPGGLTNPVSLSMITGMEYDIKTELEKVLEFLSSRLSQIFTSRQSLENDYLERLYQRGDIRDYRNLVTGEIFKGRILGAGPDGYLQMEMSDGSRASFGFKEIGYII